MILLCIFSGEKKRSPMNVSYDFPLVFQVQEYKPVLDQVNQAGPQLCQISPGDGAQTIEALVVRDNRRFEAIVEQVQRKAERLRLTKQKNLEIVGDIDELLDWFREVRDRVFSV